MSRDLKTALAAALRLADFESQTGTIDDDVAVLLATEPMQEWQRIQTVYGEKAFQHKHEARAAMSDDTARLAAIGAAVESLPERLPGLSSLLVLDARSAAKVIESRPDVWDILTEAIEKAKA
jgi:hypothetical protein